jgi:hypothetical protein
MEETNVTPTPAQATPEPITRAADPQPDTQALIANAQTAERERVGAIYDLASRLGLERSLAEDLVGRGVAIDEARRIILDKVADTAEKTRTFGQVSVPLGGRDERLTRREAVANALLHRYSPTLFNLSDPAREYRGMTLLELSREFLASAGVNVRGMSRDEIATRALHSTSDFPEVLAAVTNKTLRQAYDVYPRTFVPFCRQVLATDFKAMNRVQIGEAPQLLKVSEGGEFKRGTISESKESYRIETYGRVVAITRQVLINDDLDAFTRIPAMYGTAIATLESDVVWGIITANAAMADGVALFHATHKNLAGTGAALSVAAVGAGQALDGRNRLGAGDVGGELGWSLVVENLGRRLAGDGAGQVEGLQGVVGPPALAIPAQPLSPQADESQIMLMAGGVAQRHGLVGIGGRSIHVFDGLAVRGAAPPQHLIEQVVNISHGFRPPDGGWLGRHIRAARYWPPSGRPRCRPGADRIGRH